MCIQVKEAAKASSLQPRPEAVKVDLPSLNPARPDRSTVCFCLVYSVGGFKNLCLVIILSLILHMSIPHERPWVL